MNKAELIEAVATKLNEPKAAAERAVNTILDCIKAGVVADKAVQIVGFGTFQVRHRKAREGRNPQTKETMQIKASNSVSFKPGKAFKEELGDAP